MNSNWKLTKKAETLGYLELSDIDQPWFMCSFKPTELFSQVADLFEKELKIEDPEEWEILYKQIIDLGLLLEPTNETEAPIKEFLLHIEGNEAWFRY